MRSDAKDSISSILSSVTSMLLMDAPRRTVYGAVFGMAIYYGFEITAQVLSAAYVLSWYQFVTIGVFAMNSRTIWNLFTGKPAFSEKHEQAFAIIEKAEAAGLGKEHIRLLLLEVCRRALEEAALSSSVVRGISEQRDSSQPPA
jgi:hypothetical protein